VSALARVRALPRRTLVIAGAVLLVVVAVVVVLVVRATAGPSSPGDVTFGAGGTTATTGASQFCDVQVTECGDDAGAQAVLRVPPNTPLVVTVPAEVASTPWQVAFTFRDATGVVEQGRSPVLFGRTASPSFTLVLPTPTAQLQSAEVQQYGARISEGPNGLAFATRATWVLSVDDR
jgi:hypothetical protein